MPNDRTRTVKKAIASLTVFSFPANPQRQGLFSIESALKGIVPQAYPIRVNAGAIKTLDERGTGDLKPMIKYFLISLRLIKVHTGDSVRGPPSASHSMSLRLLPSRSFRMEIGTGFKTSPK